MNILVLGLGRMGQATAWAMTKLGHEVKGYDTNPDMVSHCLNYDYIKSGTWGEIDKKTYLDADVVISCLPYFENPKIANFCIDNGIRYCDLGGKVEVEDDIIRSAEIFALKPVFPSLGLAPGLINILAEHKFEEFPELPDNVNLYVGGIGVDDDLSGPMQYTCNWSIDGLVNEYFDDCEILEDRKIVKVPGLSNLHGLGHMYKSDDNYWAYTSYDAARTSGGLSHTARLMQERGVRNCEYGTLRLPGHYQMLQFFMKKLEFTREDMTNILRSCQVNDELAGFIGHKDKVVMAIRINKGDLYLNYDQTIYSGDTESEYGAKQHDFSAMQKCTAFTIAAVADLMAKGKMDGKKVLSYDDVNIHWVDFLANLSKLGLMVVDEQFDGND
jgi:lysine 6-dehydrogenase